MALISVSNNALSNITALPASIPTGALTLIKSITASASASIEFINGTDGVVLDGTYSSYIFSFVNIHPASASMITFQGSTNGGTSYATTMTTTTFDAYHNEAGTNTNLRYTTGYDQAQGTSFQTITDDNFTPANDESGNGHLQLFNPSSNTYVKHYVSKTAHIGNGYSLNTFSAGYFNTTSAINAIKFQMSSGNIDDGTIKLYGVK